MQGIVVTEAARLSRAALHGTQVQLVVPPAEFLKYKYMQAFDRAMMHLDKAFGFVSAPHQWVSRKDEGDKIIVVERGACPARCLLPMQLPRRARMCRDPTWRLEQGRLPLRGLRVVNAEALAGPGAQCVVHVATPPDEPSAPDSLCSLALPSTLLLTHPAGDLVFVFNFHPTNSYTDYRVGCYKPGAYKVGAAAACRAPSFACLLL